MGYAANGVCFEETSEAVAHTCAHMFPLPVANGSVLSCQSHSVVSPGIGLLSVQTCQAASCSPGSTRQAYFPSCDPLTFTSGPWPWGISAADGALVSAAVAGAWIAGAIWRWLRRSLGDHNTEDT